MLQNLQNSLLLRHFPVSHRTSSSIIFCTSDVTHKQPLRDEKNTVNVPKAWLPRLQQDACYGEVADNRRERSNELKDYGVTVDTSGGLVYLQGNVKDYSPEDSWGFVKRLAEGKPAVSNRVTSELSQNECARKLVIEALQMSGLQDTSLLVTVVLEMIVTEEDFLPTVLHSLVQRGNFRCTDSSSLVQGKCVRTMLENTYLMGSHGAQAGKKKSAKVSERKWQRLLANVGQSSLKKQDRVRLVLSTVAILLHSMIGTLNVRHIGTAVSVCIKSGSMAAAEKIVLVSKILGGASMPNARVYALLIHGYCNLGQRKAAFSTLQAMEDASVQPDLVIYNILLEGEQQPEGVKMILEKMQAAGVMPSERTYSAAIRSLGRAVRWEDANLLWQEMLMADVKPSLLTYNSFMDALANAGKTRLCRELLADMEEAGVAVDHTTYHTVIKGCARDKDPDRAVRILRQMENSGIEVMVDAYNVVMEACVRGGEMESALELAREAQTLRGLQLDAISYATLLRAAGHLRDVERVRGLLAEMSSHGVAHDTVTYRCAVHAFVRCGDGGSALCLLEEMTAAGHAPAMAVADVLIKSVDAALLRECTRVAPAGNLRRFLSDMASAGLTPTSATGGGLVRKLANSQGCTIALRVAKELLHARVRPLGLHAWQVVTAAIAREAGLLKAAAAARRLHALMAVDGTLPDSHICEVGISACTRAGDGEGALRWHEALQETRGGRQAYPVERIFLDTVDAALTAALAADVGTAAAPSADDAEAALPGPSGRNEARFVKDLAATGVRLKTRGVSKLVKQLCATSGAAEELAGPRRPHAAKCAEAAFSRAPAMNPQQQWLEKALAMVDALPGLLQVQPTSFVYLSLMDACLRQGQPERVEVMWQRMRTQLVKPNAVTWASRILALGQSGSLLPGHPQLLLAEAASDGLELNSIVLRALLKACRLVDDKDGVAYTQGMLESYQRLQSRGFQHSPILKI